MDDEAVQGGKSRNSLKLMIFFRSSIAVLSATLGDSLLESLAFFDDTDLLLLLERLLLLAPRLLLLVPGLVSLVPRLLLLVPGLLLFVPEVLFPFFQINNKSVSHLGISSNTLRTLHISNIKCTKKNAKELPQIEAASSEKDSRNMPFGTT